MVAYASFDDLLNALPAATPTRGTPQTAFMVDESVSSFVEPTLLPYDLAEHPSVTFVSARGATGKSAMAAALSRRFGAPLWRLDRDKAVSGDALTSRLSRYLNVVDPLAERVGELVPLLIVDAVDEARLRVTGLSWDEFMTELGEYSQRGIHMVILGRKRTIEDVWYALVDQVDAVSWYEISHFDQAQQRNYVDLRALRGDAEPTEAYSHAKTIVLEQLNGSAGGVLDETFAGYAPVLDAVAALLKPGLNYQNVINDFQATTVGGTRLRTLRRILEALLHREQEKVRPLSDQLGLDPSTPYSPDEQLDWLARDLLGAQEPPLSWCPEMKRAEYNERIQQFLLDHPFREGDHWASPVFSAYVAFMRIDAAKPDSLIPVAGTSGLLFEFAAARTEREPLLLAEPQFTALHTSLMAGQWTSSTSVVSLRSDQSVSPDGDSVSATLELTQAEDAATLVEAILVLNRADHLELQSPLAYLDVDFSGSIAIRSSTTSIDLGPEVFIRAKSIELTGASLQVSRDTAAGEVTGPSVELEATEAFTCQASLIGAVPPGDLAIVVPTTLKLSYPWVDYRCDPDTDSEVSTPDDRAVRFLNKLMSLARRHGHGGPRAVFLKKLEGRQGLRGEEFQQALSALEDLGVADVRGEMLFLSQEWDRHRYDGKGRPGMVRYEDKAEVWRPVVAAIGSAIS